jgi:hypothetical protein
MAGDVVFRVRGMGEDAADGEQVPCAAQACRRTVPRGASTGCSGSGEPSVIECRGCQGCERCITNHQPHTPISAACR